MEETELDLGAHEVGRFAIDAVMEDTSPRLDDHYQGMPIEPMHRSLENGLDAAQHTICKYVERYKVKGGVRDLVAARDLLIDYIEYVETGAWRGKTVEVAVDWSSEKITDDDYKQRYGIPGPDRGY